MGTKEDWAAHYAAQGSKPDTHSFDKFTSIDNALARLVELAEKEAAPFPDTPDYSTPIQEILKLMKRTNMVYGSVIQRTSGTYIQPGGNAVNFETDQAIGTKPSYCIEIEPRDANQNLVVEKFQLQHVRYLMNCTNAVTYRLYLVESDVESAYDQKAAVIFDSGTLRADNTMYIDIGANMLPVNSKLRTKGKLWYLIDWSAAPGNTAGYIVVYGEEIR